MRIMGTTPTMIEVAEKRGKDMTNQKNMTTSILTHDSETLVVDYVQADNGAAMLTSVTIDGEQLLRTPGFNHAEIAIENYLEGGICPQFIPDRVS